MICKQQGAGKGLILGSTKRLSVACAEPQNLSQEKVS
jgi:hypothetical protein